jgi:hypothetical protein
MATPRKKPAAKPREESMMGKSVRLKDGRIIYFPTEPSVIGEDKIRRAVEAVIAKRK